jgi:hypothetical protein
VFIVFLPTAGSESGFLLVFRQSAKCYLRRHHFLSTIPFFHHHNVSLKCNLISFNYWVKPSKPNTFMCYMYIYFITERCRILEQNCCDTKYVTMKLKITISIGSESLKFKTQFYFLLHESIVPLILYLFRNKYL